MSEATGTYRKLPETQVKHNASQATYGNYSEMISKIDFQRPLIDSSELPNFL